jgi:LPXTG-motif cell wall-anchored protein
MEGLQNHSQDHAHSSKNIELFVAMLLVLGLPIFRYHPQIFYIHWATVLGLLLLSADWGWIRKKKQ